MARGKRKEGAVGSRSVSDGPHAVDAHVGSRIRLRRTLLGMSQTDLAEAVGLTFQQIQKYEKGGNRVSASRLWQFAHVLAVPVSFFFEDLPADFSAGHGRVAVVPVAVEPEGGAVMTKRETLELVRAYYSIGNETVRERLYAIVKELAAIGRDEGGGVT